MALKFELNLGGTWTDVTAYVYQRDERNSVTLRRGASSENAAGQPTEITFTLNNRDGRFSPRNVAGAYYGSIGRNTPVRVSEAGTAVRAVMDNNPFNVTAGLTTPDAAALDITGDIDVRIDMTRPSWNEASHLEAWITKGTSPQFSWQLGSSSQGAGKLRWNWSTTGSDNNAATSTVGILPPHYGRKAVRVTHDVNNGAGGNTVTFYTSDTISGSWTQLGDPVVGVGTTSIFAGSGASAAVAITPDYCEVHAAKILQNIGGTERANPDFTAQTPGASSFADAAGNTWTINSPNMLTNRQFLFHGEVSEWPVQWDSSGRDVYVTVTAAGLFRRLGQGNSPLRSTMSQALASDTSVVAWWPAEDDSDATTVASGLPNGKAMAVIGTPSFASSNDFDGSDALPSVDGSRWRGVVTPYTSTGALELRFLLGVDAGGATDGARLVRLYTNGTVSIWDVIYDATSTGRLSLRGYDADGTEVVNSGAMTPTFGLEGVPGYVGVSLEQNGADIDWIISFFKIGETAPDLISSSETFATFGRATEVWVGPTGNADNVVIGHVSLHNTTEGIFDSYTAVTGYAGETAGARLYRLLANEGIPFTLIGAEGAYKQSAQSGTTALMGPQRPATLVELLRECEAVDGGILYESRDFLGFRYLACNARYSRAAALQLSYTGKDLSGITATDDDQFTRNDVTVQRQDGSSARAELTTGALSTAAPPSGVGRYDDAVTLNVWDDADLPSQASWRLALGTIDEPRYEITLNLARSVWTDAERTAVRAIEPGHRVEVTNLPAWLPAGTLSQVVIGTRETLWKFEHIITLICAPSAVFDGVETWSDSGRYDSYGSTLASSVTTTATSLSVATPVGPLWITSAAFASEFPFDLLVGAERVTVTALSGASSPQAFTVTRSVNGVVKAWAAGTKVSLFSPMIWGL